MTDPDYDREDVVEALRDSGVDRGDAVFVHSNIGFFGELTGADGRADYVESFREAIRTVIGDDGTLVVPTFTYSFTEGEMFDPAESASEMGMLAEHVRTHPDSVRSVDPNFSVAAIGPLAARFTRDVPSHSFGRDCFWERFLAEDGLFCNFNRDASSTAIHYVERCLDVPYRWDKPFAGTIRQDGSERRAVFYHYVRDLDNPAHEPDPAAFDRRASEAGVVDRAALGKGEVVCIGMRDLFDVVETSYLEDPSSLIAGDRV